MSALLERALSLGRPDLLREAALFGGRWGGSANHIKLPNAKDASQALGYELDLWL